MKNLLFTFLLSIAAASAYSSNTIDTAMQSAPVVNTTSVGKDDSSGSFKGEPIKDGAWVLVFTPIALFILSVWVINGKTKDFKLSEALTENSYPKISIQNPLYNVAELDKIQTSPALVPLLTPTIDVSDTVNGFPKSSSRYIALLSGALTLIIAGSLASAFIYLYIRTGSQPDFTHFGDVLIALGIGITPYAVNKISTAVGAKN